MKIVINKCYGGFGLSKAAVLRLRELGDEEALDTVLKAGEVMPDGRIANGETDHIPFSDQYYIHRSYDERGNSLLVQVVEELGGAASGNMAKLRVVDVPDDGNWYIDDYDGIESVHENHNVWS